jgi:hypothetical protein
MILVPPVIFFGSRAFKDPPHLNVNVFELLSMYVMIVFFSALISFIIWLLSIVIVYFIFLRVESASKAKWIVQLYGVVIIASTAIILLGSPLHIIEDNDELVPILTYMSCLAASIHFYPLPQLYIDNQQNSTT